MRLLQSISLPCDPRFSSPLLLAFLYAVAPAQAQVPTATTLTVTANGSPVTNITSQTALTLTAAVTSGSGMVMPGQVEFCDAAPPSCIGTHLLNVAQITRAGTAVMKYIPGPGTHNYQAVFLGTNLYSPSSSASATLTVAITDPTTITSGGGPGNYSLEASIAGGEKAFPTGTVSFVDTSNANYVLGTATLSPGQGSFGGQLLKTAYSTQAFPLTGCSCPVGVAVGDFNGDGKLDLVIGDDGVAILFGAGDATFTAAPVVPVPGLWWANSIAVGDFNQDGKLDFIMTQIPPSNTVTTVYTYVLLGNGDGTFTEPQVIPGTGMPNVVTGDFNGDGIPDIVLSAGGTEALGATIMLGNGDGTFTYKSSYVTGGTGPAIVGDFNGDGKVDLVLQGASDQVLYLGNGDGTFTASAQAPPAGLSAPAVSGDFTGDGFIDTVTTSVNPPPGNPIIFAFVLQTIPPNETSFTTAIAGIFIVGTGNHLIAASYSGDSNYPPSISPAIPLMAQPVPTTLGLTANPAGFNQFQPTTLTATLSPDLAQNHNATGTVTFMSGTTVVGTAPVVNGVAALSTTKLPGGINNVIATYPGDTNFSASSSSAITVPVTPVDFTISLSSSTITLETGHHITTTVTLTSINGFADPLTIACVKLPTNVTCQFNPTPATLPPNGTAAVSFYLDTDSVLGFARNNPAPGPSRPSLPPIGVALCAGVVLFRKRSQSFRPGLLLFALAAIPLALSLSGCGEIIVGPPAVEPGTYTIPVTATGATTGAIHTAQLTLIVAR
jgi:Bacterial Ig-like domain (group 3)/FG-GAP-like repeat